MMGRDKSGHIFKKVFAESTQVTMRQLEDSVIDWYIKTKEPMDKAGLTVYRAKAQSLSPQSAAIIIMLWGCRCRVYGTVFITYHNRE